MITTEIKRELVCYNNFEDKMNEEHLHEIQNWIVSFVYGKAPCTMYYKAIDLSSSIKSYIDISQMLGCSINIWFNTSTFETISESKVDDALFFTPIESEDAEWYEFTIDRYGWKFNKLIASNKNKKYTVYRVSASTKCTADFKFAIDSNITNRYEIESEIESWLKHNAECIMFEDEDIYEIDDFDVYDKYLTIDHIDAVNVDELDEYEDD